MPSSPPWNSWSLDEKFFDSLCRWTDDHSGTTLHSILDQIDTGINNTKDLRGLIPNHPFPAQSLIQALLSLLQLGIVIVKAKQAVYDFSRDVACWVDQQVLAFRTAGADQFTKKTWDNLEPVRVLVDEICKWAHDRLEDGRWKRITHGLSIGKEIDEFQTRMSNARAQFLQLSMINLSQGQDAILNGIKMSIKAILDRQEEQHDKLVASLRQDFAAQRLVHDKWEFLTLTLSRRVETRATYVDQKKRPCDPDTRMEILDDIRIWASDISDNSARVLWLTGIPGAGKSAVTASFARELNDVGCLWAQFFISHNQANTIDPAHLFPSIARQLADHCHDVADHLYNALKTKRSLVDYIGSEQAQQLFVAALQVASSLSPSQPIVVVVDALDEIEATQLAKTAKILAQATAGLPHNAKVLISSRTENIISAAFNERHVKRIHLDTSDPSSARDVKLVLYNGLQAIVEDYQLERATWPEDEILQALCDQAAGLFIWATTALAFLHVQIQRDGEECLDDVLIQLTAEGMKDIDMLYQGILQTAFQQQDDSWAWEKFRRIVGTIVILREPLRLSALAELLDLQKPGTTKRIDLYRFVRRLRPVLMVGAEPTIDENAVPRLHKSFFEFITSDRVHDHWRIIKSDAEKNLVLACFRVMKTGLHFNICQLETSHLRNVDVYDLDARVNKAILPHLSYACRFWAEHLRRTTCEVQILREVHDFMYIRFLNWLEVLSLINQLNIATRVLSFVGKWTEHKNDAVALFANDANKFVTVFQRMISDSAPHIYLSALPFAPEKSLVAQHFLQQFPKTLSLTSGKVTDWPAIQNILEGHNGSVTSVAFSPDGRRVVSGSWDDTICVWDAEKGDIVLGPLKVHNDYVTSVAFSQDGKRIVSGSRDKTIVVWDAEKGCVVLGPFKGHINWVTSVAFSRDGRHIASGSRDGKIHVWDANGGDAIPVQLDAGSKFVINSIGFSQDGKRIVSGSDDQKIRVWDVEKRIIFLGPLERHTDDVTSVAFSQDQDSQWIVSGSNDKTIRVWDAQTGDNVLGPLKGHTEYITSVAFSHDSKYIVSGSWDTTIRVWDAEKGDVLRTLKGHINWVTSVAFSQDGKRIVSGSVDKIIRIWDIETKDVVRQPLQGHTEYVTSVAFSQSGKRILSGSADKTIRVWDAKGDIVLGPLEGHTEAVTSVAFSQDDRCIVSGSWDGMICVWDAETGDAILAPLDGGDKFINSVSFSPDGKRIVSGSHDQKIRVWDIEKGIVVLGPLEGHMENITSVAFSWDQDGQRIVSGSYDKTIRVWDAQTGDNVLGPMEGHIGYVTSVAFSQDSRRIVSGSVDKTIRVWCAEKGVTILGPLNGHTKPVTSVAFSPDGRHIISGSWDETICVWDTETGDKVLGPFKGHTNVVTSVAFSQDGKSIISGSRDKSVRVWDLEMGENPLGPLQRPYINGFSDTSELEGGWISNSASTLLFWVPPWNRTGLWWPRNTAVMAEVSTRLDLSKFVHGDSWEQCCS